MSPVPTVLGRPVWYEPLRSPSWLLPAASAGAPRVTFSPAAAVEGESVSERRIREGLPMFLAEAIRFSTEARTAAVFDPEARGEASVHATVALEGEGPERRLVVRVGDPGSEAFTQQVPDDEALEDALGALPVATASALREAGVRSLWSTVYQPPGHGHAADYVRAHALCRRLMDHDAYRDIGGDAEATAERRAGLDAAYRSLAELAGRVPSPLAAMLFFAGLAAGHDAGSGAYQGFRLSANGRCTTATDPRDPVFRMSILVFRLLGDPVIAAQRVRQLGVVDDPDLAAWLTRIEDVGAVS